MPAVVGQQDTLWGPPVSYLEELKSSDPRFHHLTSYRRYRLQQRAAIHGTYDREKAGRWERNMRGVMSEVTFGGANPIGIIRWLDRFVAQCNADGVPEVAAVDLAPYFLLDPARDLYYQGKGERSAGASSFGGGFTTWPGAVNHLISLYLTDEALEEAAQKLRTLTQTTTESVKTFHERLTKAARDIPDTFTPSDIMSIFVNGLLPQLRAEAQIARSQYESRAHGLHHLVLFLSKKKTWHDPCYFKQPETRQALQLEAAGKGKLRRCPE